MRDRGALQRVLPVKNQAVDPGLPASAQVGVDFLQLVRFGLRRADDPLITATVRLADMLLKVETPTGPCWHRYNGDGYGEHDDGSAFDGTAGAARGRCSPASGGTTSSPPDATRCRSWLAMVRMASPGGMLPEQIWDARPCHRAAWSRDVPRAAPCLSPGRTPSTSSSSFRARWAGRSTAPNAFGTATRGGARRSSA